MADSNQERLEALRAQSEATREAGGRNSTLEAMLARISAEFSKAASEAKKN